MSVTTTIAVDPAPEAVIKDEPTSRVELVESERGDFVRKTYRTKPHLRWRTLGCRSKAEREFANIWVLREAGIDAVEPLRYSEIRANGCVRESTLETVFFASRTLKSEIRRELPGAERRALMAAAGRMLRTVHDAGILSASFYPRNLLVGDGGSCALRLCDQPSLIAFRRSIVGTKRAEIDLFDLAFTSGRRAELSSSDRLRIVRAYAGGDRQTSRQIWSRVESKRRWSHRGFKGAIKVAGIFGFFGAR